MIDLEHLAERARRAAARSRLRMACRICVPIAALAAATATGGASTAACACITVPLFLLAATLRWRDRIGVECATAGLALGALPIVAALLLRGCGIECRGLPALAGGEILCLMAGALTGLGVTWHASRASDARPRRWIATMLTASATAALGCVGLGVAALALTIFAIVAAGALALIPMTVRAA